MTNSLQLANRVREVLLNGQWIANTNYKKELLSISYSQAIQKINNLNSIASLTFHINYYLTGLLNVFENGILDMSDTNSFLLPENLTEKEWNCLVNTFLQQAEKFAVIISQLTTVALEAPFINEKYGNNLKNIEGFIEHSYYHLGQLVLIKKIITFIK